MGISIDGLSCTLDVGKFAAMVDECRIAARQDYQLPMLVELFTAIIVNGLEEVRKKLLEFSGSDNEKNNIEQHLECFAIHGLAMMIADRINLKHPSIGDE